MSFIFASYRIKIYFKIVYEEDLMQQGNGNKVSSVGIIVFHVEAA
jgi:hypothetical protein